MLIALTVTGIPATAQTNPTPIAPQTATANLVTKADLRVTRTQLGQKVAAQSDELTALRQQILTLKAQSEALDRQVSGMKVPATPKGARVWPGR